MPTRNYKHLGKVNASQLAEILGVTAGIVAKFKRQGLPFETKGRQTIFNTAQAIDWYMRQKMGVDPSGTSKEEAIRGKLVAEMEKAQMEAALARGDLMSIDEFTAQMSRQITDTRNALLCVHSTMAPMLRRYAGDKWKIIAREMDKEIRSALTSFADEAA